MHYYPLGVLIASWLVWFWETYLELRQYNVCIKTQKVPRELEKQIDHETFTKSKAYSIDKIKFGLITGLFGQVQTTLTLYYYLMPYFWNLSRDIMTIKFGFARSNSIEWEIFQTLMFLFITSLLSTIINLPASIYGTFVIEQRHGFNKQTARFYAWDKTKAFLTSFLIYAPVVSAAIYIIRKGGPYFFLYLWVFLMMVACLLVLFNGEIAAIFDKFTPLPPGELRDRIELLAQKLGFPLKDIFVVEGSKRSAHSNAYQTGLFNRKRVVLYDTLLQDYHETNKGTKETETEDESNTEHKTKDESKQKKKAGCNHDEVLAVLCHELGHWHCSHLLKNLALSGTNCLIMFVMFSKFYNDPKFYAAFGFTDDNPVMIGLALFMMILSPYNEVQGFIAIYLSRRFEYEADRFAKKMGYADKLQTALTKINSDNLGFPVHDELYSKFSHSHPTLIQRLKALDKND